MNELLEIEINVLITVLETTLVNLCSQSAKCLNEAVVIEFCFTTYLHYLVFVFAKRSLWL